MKYSTESSVHDNSEYLASLIQYFHEACWWWPRLSSVTIIVFYERGQLSLLQDNQCMTALGSFLDDMYVII